MKARIGSLILCVCMVAGIAAAGVTTADKEPDLPPEEAVSVNVLQGNGKAQAKETETAKEAEETGAPAEVEKERREIPIDFPFTVRRRETGWFWLLRWKGRIPMNCFTMIRTEN